VWERYIYVYYIKYAQRLPQQQQQQQQHPNQPGVRDILPYLTKNISKHNNHFSLKTCQGE